MKVLPELQDYIWTLKKEEYDFLEKSLLSEGCRDALICGVIDGEQVLIDGHNRLNICKQHNIPYEIIDLSEIDSIEKAKAWMDENQLGRRNLTADQWRISIGRLYNRSKKNIETQTINNQYTKVPSDQNEHPAKTADKIAQDYKISAPTVRRYAKEAEEYEQLEKEKPEIASAIKSGEKSFKDIKKEQKKEQRLQEIQETKNKIEEEGFDPPDGLFDVIVIDPPWAYDEKGGFNSQQHDSDSNRGGVDYPTMTVNEIKNINLPAAGNSILFLWTTHSFLKDAFALLEEWGYNYKATIVWDKEKMGIGRTIRLQCEFCLLGIMGKPTINGSSERDIIREARREHSRKPTAFYKMVERINPGRKLDYFAREPRNGWCIYGAETNKF